MIILNNCPLCNKILTIIKGASKVRYKCLSCTNFYLYFKDNEVEFLEYYIGNYFICCDKTMANCVGTALYTDEIPQDIIFRTNFVLPKYFDYNGLKRFMDKLLMYDTFS